MFLLGDGDGTRPLHRRVCLKVHDLIIEAKGPFTIPQPETQRSDDIQDEVDVHTAVMPDDGCEFLVGLSPVEFMHTS